EPVDVRQLDVEEHDLRLQALDGGDGRDTVRRLADDLEAFFLEERPRRRAEARVVVDDEDRPHPTIVAEERRSFHTVNRTLCGKGRDRRARRGRARRRSRRPPRVHRAAAARRTARQRAAVESTGARGFGGFAALHPLGEGRLLAASTDGVGTKLMLARARGALAVCGADLAAHCINDVLTCGATPLVLLDYVAANE